MNTSKKYPWLKVVLGYSLLCPAIAGLLFFTTPWLFPHVESFWPGKASISAASSAPKDPFGLMDLAVISLFPFGGIAMFGLPFLIFSLFFVGFKVHKGIMAYCFAAGWGAFLAFFITVLHPRNNPEPGEVYFILMAAFSLALAALLVTYWVVPPKATDDGFQQ